ncbi:ScbR family autoregulator-binding transcription factor [Kitasatospora cineracea]|uniref:ScbR family autoregulator-binding transcription factor n=1 Tax=Kitasatospora cineracea TaxID=88074 RepID=UPI003423A97B
MATQDRATRTRGAILKAAAQVFEERGYQAATIAEILAAAGVTKGALYFHFQSKEELAHGVLAEQDLKLVVPERPCRTQEFVDMCFTHAHRLQNEPMVRAAVRLSLDMEATGLDRTAPFRGWQTVMTDVFERAQAQGELLPHVVPAETSAVAVGAFAGVQQMSQVLTDYQDLPERISSLLRHLLPSVMLSSVLASLDIAPDRGARVFAELTADLATA